MDECTQIGWIGNGAGWFWDGEKNILKYSRRAIFQRSALALCAKKEEKTKRMKPEKNEE